MVVCLVATINLRHWHTRVSTSYPQHKETKQAKFYYFGFAFLLLTKAVKVQIAVNNRLHHDAAL